MSHYGEIERLASDNFGYFTSSAAREVGGARQGYLGKPVGPKLVRELKHEVSSDLIDAIDKSKSKPSKKNGGAK